MLFAVAPVLTVTGLICPKGGAKHQLPVACESPSEMKCFQGAVLWLRECGGHLLHSVNSSLMLRRRRNSCCVIVPLKGVWDFFASCAPVVTHSSKMGRERGRLSPHDPLEDRCCSSNNLKILDKSVPERLLGGGPFLCESGGVSRPSFIA